MGMQLDTTILKVTGEDWREIPLAMMGWVTKHKQLLLKNDYCKVMF